MIADQLCSRALLLKYSARCQARHADNGVQHKICHEMGNYPNCSHKELFRFDSAHTMNINEIYKAISGEGATAGRVCTIVRVSGCNLRCSYCDTVYAYDEGTEMTTEEVLSKIEMVDVLYTGGEPLYDKEASLNFLKALQASGKNVFVETNGSIDIRPFVPFAHLVMDIKMPSSGMNKAMCLDNIKLLDSNDEIKFVVADRTDYDIAKKVIEKFYAYSNTCHIYISPTWGDMGFIQDLSRWMIEDESRMLLSLQQHKIIWPPEKRGV